MTTEQSSLRINAELKRSLEREARREERSMSYLAAKAIEATLHSRAEKCAEIRTAIAEANRGGIHLAGSDGYLDLLLGYRLGASASGTGYVLDHEVMHAASSTWARAADAMWLP